MEGIRSYFKHALCLGLLIGSANVFASDDLDGAKNAPQGVLVEVDQAGQQVNVFSVEKLDESVTNGSLANLDTDAKKALAAKIAAKSADSSNAIVQSTGGAELDRDSSTPAYYLGHGGWGRGWGMNQYYGNYGYYYSYYPNYYYFNYGNWNYGYQYGWGWGNRYYYWYY
jgi:hypothetical protein